jgi:streptogramin lyase
LARTETEDVAFAFGSVWVANTFAHTISRVDPRTNRISATIHVDGSPEGLAPGFGSLWASLLPGRSTTVLRIDPATNRLVETLSATSSVATGGGMVWVQHDSGLQRLDPGTDRFLGTPDRFQAGPVALGRGAIWVIQGFQPTPAEQRRQGVTFGVPLLGTTTRVYEVDPRTMELRTRPVIVGSLPYHDPVVGYGSLWVPAHHAVLRITANGKSMRGAAPFYSDAQALGAALQRGAGQCRDFADVAQRLPFPGESVGRCTVGGSPVTIRVYTDPAWFAPALRVRRLGPQFVEGTNWVVATNSAEAAARVKHAIGETAPIG